MQTINLEFTLEQLHELQVTMSLRKAQLVADTTNPNEAIRDITMRQLERVSPMVYYISETVKENHKKQIEEEVELEVERQMDRLDKKLMQGHITQNSYDERTLELAKWAASKLQSI
jgi:hypothetical protein